MSGGSRWRHAAVVCAVCGGAALAQSGRVITENGEAPRHAVVQRVCGDQVREQVKTDEEGAFHFTGDSTGHCIVRAHSGSARSLDVDLSRIPGGDLGTLIVHAPRGASRMTVSVKALATPESARREFTGGVHLAQSGKWRDAAKRFEKAVAIYPDFGPAWMQLGLVQEKLGATAKAETAYRRAVTADPKFVPAHLRLMVLAVAREDWPAILAITDRIVAIRPRRVGLAYYFNALANLVLGHVDAAISSLAVARELDPNGKVTKLDLVDATIAEKRGDIPGAITAYRRYLEHGADAKESAELNVKIAALQQRAKQD